MGEAEGSPSLLGHSHLRARLAEMLLWGFPDHPPGLVRKMVPRFPPWLSLASIKTRLSSS